MILSIDRVLQLIADGKSIEKISEMAKCEHSDVIQIIEKARNLLLKYEKSESKRKVIIKKKTDESRSLNSQPDVDKIKELLAGAELAAIPVNSQLTMNIGSRSTGNPGHAGIGIIIYDHEERQIGKVSDYIGTRTQHASDHSVLIKALKLAVYFQASELRIRTDSETLIRELKPEFKTKDNDLKKFISETAILINKIGKFKLEHIEKNLNDKALYLAEKGYAKVKDKKTK